MKIIPQLVMLSALTLTYACQKGGGGGGAAPAPEQKHDSTVTVPQTTTPTTTDTPSTTPSTPAPTPSTPGPSTTTPTTPPTPPAPAEEAFTIYAAAEFVEITDAVRKDKLEKAINVLETVLNSPLFRSRVKSYTYNGVKAFVDNNGQSNEKVLTTVQEGSETLTPGKDHTINVQLTFYRSNNSTVGWTTPTSRLININLKFFDQYTLAEVAGNLAHEWLHKLGYGHASRYSESRDHSVPYAIGYMVEDLGEDVGGE